MSEAVKRKLRELVRDDTIHPRGGRTDPERVSLFREHIQAEEKFPPYHIDQRNRILDGWHRREAELAEHGKNWEVECIVVHCQDDGDALEAAVKLNAKHGLPLTATDRIRVIRMMRRYRQGVVSIAAALGITTASLKAQAEGRIARAPVQQARLQSPRPLAASPSPSIPATPTETEEVVLSKPLEHLAGKTLTVEQATVNRSLGNWPQRRVVRELIAILEAGSLDANDGELMRDVQRLQSLLEPFARASVVSETPGVLAESQV
jgi:hypothetical protein